METKFQTSFIPKKPLVTAPGSAIPRAAAHHGVSLFMTFGVIIFLLSLAAMGGAYAWKQYLIPAQVTYKKQLSDSERQFNVDLIEQLKQANVQIDQAKKLLANHIATSQIFGIIGRFTSENVRFTSMDLTTPQGATAKDGVKLSMNGYGTSLVAVAFQSDVLGQLEQYGLRKVVKNPIISNPSLDGNGTVSFGFTATVDPSSISYTQALSGLQPGSQASSTTH